MPTLSPSFGQVFVAAVGELPFLTLQAAAIVGMVSVLLLLKRDVPLNDTRYKVSFGLVFGLTGFVLTMLVSEFIQLPSKPYLRADALFLSGLLGGWQGGLLSLGIGAAARLMFGGAHMFFPAFIDLALITAGGIALHGWFKRRALIDLGWRELAVCFSIRLGVVLLSVSVVYMLGMIGEPLYLSNMARRLAAVAVTLPMMGAIFMLLRRDAWHRDQVRRREAAALTDTLTGLPNRRALREHIERSGLDGPENRALTIVFVEVVNMGELFAVRGDDWSDGFWRRLAQDLEAESIKRLLGAYEPRVFLFSDTSLTVVVRGITASELEASDRMARLHAELTALLQSGVQDDVPAPQVRIGAATLDAPAARGAASSLRNISLALQGSEHAVQVFPSSFAMKAQADERVRRKLVEWVKHGMPPLQYQPKFSLASLRMTGAEALLRAVDDDGRPLPPPYVLEIAERHRLLLGLEWATLLVVTRDIQRVKRFLPDGLCLAVNISAASLVTSGFGERVLALLRDRGVDPTLLTIEVTETNQLPAIDMVRDNVRTLTEAGVRLSLDDFGTGYAALAVLAQFPFNEVKIDRWMTAGLGQTRIRQAIELAAESARRYGAELVIEGVETEAQRQELIRMGIDHAQGYLYSAAVPLDRLAGLTPCFSGSSHPTSLVGRLPVA